jgi:hypothetical protein
MLQNVRFIYSETEGTGLETPENRFSFLLTCDSNWGPTDIYMVYLPSPEDQKDQDVGGWKILKWILER